MLHGSDATDVRMDDWPRRLVTALRRSHQVAFWRRAALVVAFLVVVGALDYVTGPQLSMLIGYVLAVVAAAFFLSRRWAVPIALASAVAAVMVALLHPDADAATTVAVVNGLLRLAIYVVLLFGVALLRSTVVHLDELAHVDELTGLRNRRGFLDIAGHERLRAIRTGSPLTFVAFDLDGLKATNDQHGHAAGDRLIISFARALTESFRSSDSIGRLGGDEFIVMLPDTPGDGAVALTRRLVESVTDAAFGAGVGWTADATLPLDDVIAAADRALYRAKGRPDAVELEFLPARAESHDRERRPTTPVGDR